MLAGKLVHVVDDDRGFLKGIERLLGAHGFRVRTFTSAERFQAEADPGEAACLIFDIQLGAVSGIELLRRLSRSGNVTPVVLVSANDSDQTRKDAMASGCKAFLRKPFTGNTLMEAVSGAIGLRRSS
jgi:FixJ family two-component response regulator